MITLGIDLSSMPEGTAACRIRWMKNRALAEPSVPGCDDKELDRLINTADAVGIDAPFGWPEEFVQAVARWKRTVWSKDDRRRLQFRATDLYVQDQLKIWPLSVSTDRIDCGDASHGVVAEARGAGSQWSVWSECGVEGCESADKSAHSKVLRSLSGSESEELGTGLSGIQTHRSKL